ncbi:MAG: deoxyribose-phosphate aldolase [Christensenellales bacterium]|jgi:deoxyribose-phosphate aldolase
MLDFSKMTQRDFGKCFDYAILRKDITEAEIRKECKVAIEYDCHAFCFGSTYWIPVVAEELAGTDVLVGAGIAYPYGNQTSTVKCFETEEAVRLGATSLDNSMNLHDLKDKKYNKILQEFKDFVKAAQGVETKMIIDVAFLTDEEIATACKLIAEAGIGWAKSATGQWDGPSIEQVLIMVNTLKGTNTRVKVSGVKFPHAQNAYAYLLAGAELLGTRAAPKIIQSLDIFRKIGMVPAYQG